MTATRGGRRACFTPLLRCAFPLPPATRCAFPLPLANVHPLVLAPDAVMRNDALPCCTIRLLTVVMRGSDISVARTGGTTTGCTRSCPPMDRPSRRRIAAGSPPGGFAPWRPRRGICPCAAIGRDRIGLPLRTICRLRRSFAMAVRPETGGLFGSRCASAG